jgi:hypothetical protein
MNLLEMTGLDVAHQIHQDCAENKVKVHPQQVYTMQTLPRYSDHGTGDGFPLS